MAGARHLQLGHDDTGDSAHESDREVDLADQEHEDDADADHRDAGHLSDQFREVDGGEEDVRLRGEEDRDSDDPDDHRQAADVAGLERLPARAKNAAETVRPDRGGPDLRRSRGAHAAALAGLPTVIASTISCWFVLLFS